MAKAIGKKSKSLSYSTASNSNGKRAATSYDGEKNEVASEIRNFINQLVDRYASEALDRKETPTKRPVGRPKGSGKKRVEAEAPIVKRPVGRPKGSTKKAAVEPPAPKRPVGRPKGSGKKRIEAETPVVKRPVGRPKGSTKKAIEAARDAQATRPDVNRKAGLASLAGLKPIAATKRPIGRPKGSSKYGEPIRTVRVPESIAMRIDGFVDRKGDVVRLYNTMVQAGFPSPAEDASYETLDLGAFLMPNPPATFFVRATGESMRDAGIFPGDVLIVDRSLEPSNGDVVVAALNGEFTVKRLFKTATRTELRPENRKFPPIAITEDLELTIWGVVKKVIHNV